MLIYVHIKIRTLSQLGAEKILFPPKPNGHTYRRTDGRTDISGYRVASLLINDNIKLHNYAGPKRLFRWLKYIYKILYNIFVRYCKYITIF